MAFRSGGSGNGIAFCNDIGAIRTFLAVPSTSGDRATGTWSINISGNAVSTNKLLVQNFSGSNTWKTIPGIGTGDSSYPTQGVQHSFTCQGTDSKQVRMNGEGDMYIPGVINSGWKFVSSNKIKSGGGNSAMSFVSVNGNYNFRDAGDTANTGQIRAGNVTFRSQSHRGR